MVSLQNLVTIIIIILYYANEGWRLHKAAHTTKILSIVVKSSSDVVLINDMGKVLCKIL